MSASEMSFSWSAIQIYDYFTLLHFKETWQDYHYHALQHDVDPSPHVYSNFLL